MIQPRNRQHTYTPDHSRALLNLLEDMRPEWWDQAACRGVGPDAFFPHEPRSGSTAVYQFALAMCRRCPVQAQCAEAGMDEADGVWGGLMPADRRPGRQSRRPNGRVIHGKKSTYTNHGCRCDQCRAANTESKRRWRARTGRTGR